MAAKKKPKKKQTSSKRTPKKKPASKRQTPKKKLAKKRAQKRALGKMRAIGKTTTGGKAASAPKKPALKKSQTLNTVTFSRERSRARSGGQSGDLQGLSNVERANSESVDELIEEGNAFEAEVVTGVEDAGNADEDEVHTHEVPEDDVPDEYLDKDK